MANTYHGKIEFRGTYRNGGNLSTNYIVEFSKGKDHIAKDPLSAPTLSGLAQVILDYDPHSTWNIQNSDIVECMDLETPSGRSRLIRKLTPDELNSFCRDFSVLKTQA